MWTQTVGSLCVGVIILIKTGCCLSSSVSCRRFAWKNEGLVPGLSLMDSLFHPSRSLSPFQSERVSAWKLSRFLYSGRSNLAAAYLACPGCFRVSARCQTRLTSLLCPATKLAGATAVNEKSAFLQFGTALLWGGKRWFSFSFQTNEYYANILLYCRMEIWHLSFLLMWQQAGGCSKFRESTSVSTIQICKCAVMPTEVHVRPWMKTRSSLGA